MVTCGNCNNSQPAENSVSKRQSNSKTVTAFFTSITLHSTYLSAQRTVYLLLIIIFTLINTTCSSSGSKKFNSNKWKKEPEQRYKMVNNIIDGQLLIGMSKKKIIEQLGPDTEEGPCVNCIGYSTNKPDQGFSIDHEVLEINFDNQDKVTSVRINSW